MKHEGRPAIRRWILLAIAFVVLNAALTFANVWPTLWITTRYELSIEIAALLAALAVYSEIFGPPRRWVIGALTLPLLLLCIGRYAEVTAPALYGRPVNIYWDGQHLPKVAAMLAEVASPWQIAAGATGFALLIGTLIFGLYWSLARVWDGLSVAAPRRVLGGFAAALVALFTVSSVLDWAPRHWFSLPVTATYAQQVAFLLDATAPQLGRTLAVEPLAESDMQRVAGADVLLVSLESYGAVSFDDPAIAAVVTPARTAFEEAAAATGRSVVSAFLESPTFGGASWLAHATMMTGFQVADTATYNLLLTQQRETLSTRFSAAGYRVLALMPGMRNEWPEGAFYGFNYLYGETQLDYRGPEFGWWRIPDQYALAKLDALELGSAARPPVFAFFPTINTHIPFRPTPPVQPSWPRLLTQDPYDAPAVAASLAVLPEWTNLGPAYAASFAYTFSYLASYLRARPDADLVIVLIGDHQPAASVSGRGARWDVPVHVITSRSGIADALREKGFISGVALAPGAPAIGKMRELTDQLLGAFDSHGPAPAPIAEHVTFESAD